MGTRGQRLDAELGLQDLAEELAAEGDVSGILHADVLERALMARLMLPKVAMPMLQLYPSNCTPLMGPCSEMTLQTS